MNARRRQIVAWLAASLCAIGPSEARACGELMLRSLGAMRFHPFTTKSPAGILLYSGPVAIRWSDSVLAGLHAELEKVGHNVHPAQGLGELGRMLATSRYDVLIAHADDMFGASGEIDRVAHGPALIPVIDASAPNEHEMLQRYPRLVTGGFNALLRAIEQAMTSAKA